MNPMLPDVLLASLHHLLVFTLVAVLFAEWVLAGGSVDAARLRLLGRLDGAYGALAGGVLLAGFARAFWGAKGFAFYAGNPLFWSKLGVFAAIGLLSIAPTVRLIRWRRAAAPPDAAQLRSLRGWMAAQLALLPLLPVLAALMARGIGR